MPRHLYTLLLVLLLPGVVLYLLWRARRQPAYLRHWGERFGIHWASAPDDRPILWIHAVSVGETRAAQPLIKLLQQRWPRHRILLTHMTPTGRETGMSLYGDTVLRAYLPYDYPWTMRRFLKHFRPALGIVMETELWPNLVVTCHQESIPLLLVNARLSEKSAQGYARWPTLARQTLQGLTAIAAQTNEDAARLASLGARDVQIAGNMKFDIAPPPEQLALGARLRRDWQTSANPRPILLAASTRDGEEALLLDALPRCVTAIPDLLLVIVPRHPQRFGEVAALIAARGLPMQRRSDTAPLRAETRVLLGDSMGEMFAYYAASDVAFIGGSLLDYGSQNLIEACAVGLPVLIGPSTFNFAEAAQSALACGAAWQVANVEALMDSAAKLLGDAGLRQKIGVLGQDFAAHHRGASQRTLALVATHLNPQ